jgi:hypothetical protein
VIHLGTFGVDSMPIWDRPAPNLDLTSRHGLRNQAQPRIDVTRR